MHDLLPKPSPTVVFKELDEGAVLFCSRTEVYFGLNEVGSFIWNLLPEISRFDELDGVMADRFPDAEAETRMADAREFLEMLGEYELVAPAAGRETE